MYVCMNVLPIVLKNCHRFIILLRMFTYTHIIPFNHMYTSMFMYKQITNPCRKIIYFYTLTKCGNRV